MLSTSSTQHPEVLFIASIPAPCHQPAGTVQLARDHDDVEEGQALRDFVLLSELIADNGESDDRCSHVLYSAMPLIIVDDGALQPMVGPSKVVDVERVKCRGGPACLAVLINGVATFDLGGGFCGVMSRPSARNSDAVTHRDGDRDQSFDC